MKIFISECNTINGERCIFPYIRNGLRNDMSFLDGLGLVCPTSVGANDGLVKAEDIADNNCFAGLPYLFQTNQIFLGPMGVHLKLLQGL